MEEEIIKKIDMLSLRMIEDIKTIVKMPSVEGTFQQGAPFGKDIALTLDKVLEIAQSLGFETKNLDHYIGYAQYGKGEDYIGIIGHLDVVPTGLGWKHPPFSAYEEDGYIYSRGILDNKGPIMTCLYALYAIKELNIKLHKPVRIIFGCDEETGFKDLEYYLKHEKPPVMGWTPDCKYPVVFAENERRIRLSGEGYFKVAKDTQAPFIVETDLGEIRVMGTEFNVKCYPDETIIATTLVNGKVSFINSEVPERILAPGQQLLFERGNQEAEIRQVNVCNYIGWKDNQLIFHKETLEEIMRILARWYDIEVVFENNDLKQLEFSGNLNKYTDIETFFRFFGIGANVRFQLSGRTVYIKSAE